MAQVDTNGLVQYPFDGIIPTAGSNSTLDAAEEFVCGVVFAPRTGSISKIGWRLATNTSGVMTVDVGVEQVAESVGAPVGTSVGARTLWAANTFGQEDMNGAATGIRYTALTAAASVTEGQALAVTIRVSAFTGGSIAVCSNVANEFLGHNIYVATYLGSSWSVINRAFPVILYYNGVGPVQTLGCSGSLGSLASNSFQQSTNPNRRGCKFKFPFPAKLYGIGINLDADVDSVLTVYGSDEYTSLGTFTFDKDLRSATSAFWSYATFSTPITIAKDTFYRWAVYPNASGTNINLYSVSFLDDGAYKGIAGVGMGTNCVSTTINNDPASDAHSWTDDDTKRYCCVFLIEQLDDGASTGGAGPVFGGMVTSQMLGGF